MAGGVEKEENLRKGTGWGKGVGGSEEALWEREGQRKLGGRGAGGGKEKGNEGLRVRVCG